MKRKKSKKKNFLIQKKKKITLNDYKSNILIVNFWATWCAPCKEEMPHLNQLKSKNKFKNIEIIPINIEDQKLEKLNSFYKDLNLNKLEIFYGPSLKMSKIFKLRGIPTTLFIDKEGYEFARVIGFVDFENESFLDWLANYL